MYEFIEVNLLPAEYRVRKRAIRLEAWIIWPAIFVGVEAFLLFGWYSFLQTKVGALHSKVTELDAQIALNAPIEKEIKHLAEEKKVIVGKIMALERISVNRAKWVRLLETFCKYLPEYTWLTSLKESSDAAPQVVIQGKTRSFPEVATFMSDLKQSDFITTVDLTKIEQVDEKEMIYGFELICTINPNAGLKAME